jgi:hypothetical protein
MSQTIDQTFAECGLMSNAGGISQRVRVPCKIIFHQDGVSAPLPNTSDPNDQILSFAEDAEGSGYLSYIPSRTLILPGNMGTILQTAPQLSGVINMIHSYTYPQGGGVDPYPHAHKLVITNNFLRFPGSTTNNLRLDFDIGPFTFVSKHVDTDIDPVIFRFDARWTDERSNSTSNIVTITLDKPGFSKARRPGLKRSR